MSETADSSATHDTLQKKPKSYRYRRDLTSYHFAVRHEFKKGLRKIMPEPLYVGDMPEYLFLPHWEKTAPGQFRFLKLKVRREHITILTNADVKRVCGYIRLQKTDILNCLFDMTGLCVLAASMNDAGAEYSARFRYNNISCYGFVTRLIKDSVE